MDKARFKLEEVQRDQNKKAEREKKSREDIQLLLNSAPEEDIRLSLGEENDESVEDNEDDSDWEDLEEDTSKDQSYRKYNTMSLKHFSMVCDRYLVSDRAGAMLANGLLKDLGIVKKSCTSKLICPSKLRRQREKWGKMLMKEKRAEKLPRASILMAKGFQQCGFQDPYPVLPVNL